MDKRTQLLAVLHQSEHPVTGVELQATLGVSRRSVVNYVAALNRKDDNLVLSSNRGYSIGRPSKAQDILERAAHADRLPSDREDREAFLVRDLLLNHQHRTVDQLAEALSVSQATLHADLRRVHGALTEHGLHVSIKRGVPMVVGHEQDRSRLVMDLVTRELEASSFRVGAIQRLFSRARIREIQAGVMSILDAHGLSLDDYSLLDYALHLAILVEFGGREPTAGSHPPGPTGVAVRPDARGFVLDVATYLRNRYELALTDEALSRASALVVTRLVPAGMPDAPQAQRDELGPRAAHLLEAIVARVHNRYGINLEDSVFLGRFGLHLRHLLERADSGVVLPGRSSLRIKDEHPFLDLMARYVGALIEESTSVPLAEAEVSYIALHLGVQIERQKAEASQVVYVLVMHEYLELSDIIIDRLRTSYPNANCVGVLADHDDVGADVDLVVSLLPTSGLTDRRILHVSPIPTDADYAAILSALEGVRRRATGAERALRAKALFSSEHFYRTEARAAKAVVDLLSASLVEAGTVEASYRHSVESYLCSAPPAYGHVAIVHPLTDGPDLIHDSAVAVWMNDTPVPWFGTEVNVVLMLAVRNRDAAVVQDIFNWVLKDSGPGSSVEWLTACQDMDAFVAALSGSDL